MRLMHVSTIQALNDDYLIDADGKIIKPGENIWFTWAGQPVDMPTPWTLVKAFNEISTERNAYMPCATVRAANGRVETYKNIDWNSPRTYATFWNPEKQEYLTVR